MISRKLPKRYNLLDELTKPIISRELFLSNGAQVFVRQYSRKWDMMQLVNVRGFLVDETVTVEFLNSFLA